MSATLSYVNLGNKIKTYYGLKFPPHKVVSGVLGYIHDPELISVPNAEVHITFKDADGSVLSQLVVLRGEMPSAEAPTRKGYEFTGWTPTIQPADADITYVATYRQNNKKKK